jgi:hypothetical protein
MRRIWKVDVGARRSSRYAIDLKDAITIVEMSIIYRTNSLISFPYVPPNGINNPSSPLLPKVTSNQYK